MKPPLRIEKPCPLISQLFQEGEARSFCAQCQHHVHDLSSMNKAERHAVLQQYRAGQRVCIAYRFTADGQMMTPLEPENSGRRKFLRFLLPLGLASCRTTDKLGAGFPITPVSPPPPASADKSPVGKGSYMTGGIPPYNPTRWQRFKDFFRR
jgi:hypothetical protein